ncbi:MAG: PIN domain nuclease [Bacteroidetes bacterium]|nr:PIN domain nuclease [Bacteroidota bacterium]MBU2584312.1 PIN domain nuclease [Bacteroidota bacterium]
MKTFFLDTSFIVALEDRADQYHREAKEYWGKNFLKSFSRVIITLYVFDEVVTYLCGCLNAA